MFTISIQEGKINGVKAKSITRSQAESIVNAFSYWLWGSLNALKLVSAHSFTTSILDILRIKETKDQGFESAREQINS